MAINQQESLLNLLAAEAVQAVLTFLRVPPGVELVELLCPSAWEVRELAVAQEDQSQQT